MNFAVIVSPALSVPLPIPRSASVVADPVVNFHSVIVPSVFLTSTVIDPWGFTNWIFVSVPVISFSSFMS